MRPLILPRRFRAVRSAAVASSLLAVLACTFISPSVVIADATTVQPADKTAPADFHVDVRKTLEYLASDELEGRGVGTEGLDKAADRIADDFRKLGLKPVPGNSDYFQPFKMVTAVTPDPKTSLSAGDGKYKLLADYTPLSFTNESSFEGDVVFAGYGITSKKYNYDDYAGIDVKGKVVVVMRFEPHVPALRIGFTGGPLSLRADVHPEGSSRFVKDQWSEEAPLFRKAQNAAKHGAVAMVLVNPPTYHPADLLVSFTRSGGEKVSIPVVQVYDKIADAWLSQAGMQNLKTLQAGIDKDGKPASVAMPGVKLKGTVALHREEKVVKNVMAMRPGAGEHADEYLIIGAHYDHLGFGGFGSLSPGSKAIHHGADDNASGTVSMLSLADHFAHVDPRQKTLIFIAFTGEEEGLIGSAYFVNHPPVPLDKVVAMLNLDMVGRVRNNVIYVGGAGTAPSFDGYLKAAGIDSPLVQKTFGRGGMGPSDHMSFALKKVPVIFFFSGLHIDYHRPTDTADKINYRGLEDVVKLSIKLLNGLEDMQKEKYIDASDKNSMSPMHTGTRVTLGIVPDYSAMDDAARGVKISGTSSGSPAAKAGLKEGDVIVQWNADKVDSLQQLTNFLGAARPGEKVKLIVMRGKTRVELEATLAAKKE
jgi:hypothetical protein